jgi:hypothetical protein
MAFFQEIAVFLQLSQIGQFRKKMSLFDLENCDLQE